MITQGTQWSFEDYDYLYKHFNVDGVTACAKALQRSETAVQSKAAKLGLVPQGAFTPQELSFANSYGKALGGALIFVLPYRTSVECEELIECKNKHSV